MYKSDIVMLAKLEFLVVDQELLQEQVKLPARLSTNNEIYLMLVIISSNTARIIVARNAQKH